MDFQLIRMLPRVSVRLFSSSSTSEKNLVLVGTGWGGMSFLKSVDASKFKSVTIVSPRNYFLFTPLLPSVAVGTTEPRSIMEPVRQMITKRRKKYPSATIEYVEMDAVGIDLDKKILKCEYVGPKSNSTADLTANIPYDLLVLSPGAKSNTFNTPGVEQYCHFMKEMPQARQIRNAILDAFEMASICKDDQERKRLLSFVTIGAGPTGVEFCAELNDFISEDLDEAYREVAHMASVTIIQSSDTILNMFDRAISDYAEENFKRIAIKLVKNARVVSVGPKSLRIENTLANTMEDIDYGTAIWTAGVAPRRITAQVIEAIGEKQKGNNLIAADGCLRVLGAKDIYAIGDCVSIERPKLVENAESYIARKFGQSKSTLHLDDFISILENIKKEYPNVVDISNAESLFFNHVGRARHMTKEQFINCLSALEKSFKAAPQSAQVAQQQAEHLAQVLAGNCTEPWTYTNRGMMSYVGQAKAVLQSPQLGVLKGYPVYNVWRGAYASKLLTMRARTLVVWDWFKAALFGRDISRM